jgi:hypothetical protein
MMTGRCLCGAVRWRAKGDARLVHHCHCGMCRRWTGAAFATLAWFPRAAVEWSGTPAGFRASPIAVRTHCGACGTPLSLAYDARDDIALTVGSMDDPGAVRPIRHYGVEGRLPWADIGARLPEEATRERW